MINVTICIATCNRPKMLSNLLESLSRQTILNIKNFNIEIAVVDNDISASALPVINNWKKIKKLPIVYEIEYNKGIAFVRNHLVRLGKKSDFIAFIDDDEVAYEHWLEELFRVQKKYDADIIAGPVYTILPNHPPSWIIKGNFFERPNYSDGENIQFAGTGNILFRKTILEKIDGPFDESLGLQGGEDTILLAKLRMLLGIKIFWAKSAITEEYVTQNRLNPLWIIRRNYRAGLTFGKIDYFLFDQTINLKTVRFLKGILKMMLGTLLFFPALFIGKAEQVRALCYFANGIGSLASLIGIPYHEYSTIHEEHFEY